MYQKQHEFTCFCFYYGASRLVSNPSSRLFSRRAFHRASILVNEICYPERIEGGVGRPQMVVAPVGASFSLRKVAPKWGHKLLPCRPTPPYHPQQGLSYPPLAPWRRGPDRQTVSSLPGSDHRRGVPQCCSFLPISLSSELSPHLLLSSGILSCCDPAFHRCN